MKVSGSYTFPASAAKVWESLTDPTVLAGCIPGCEGLDAVGEDEYQAVMTVAVGPIRSRYNAKPSAHFDGVDTERILRSTQSSGDAATVSSDAKPSASDVTIGCRADFTRLDIMRERPLRSQQVGDTHRGELHAIKVVRRKRNWNP